MKEEEMNNRTKRNMCVRFTIVVLKLEIERPFLGI